MIKTILLLTILININLAQEIKNKNNNTIKESLNPERFKKKFQIQNEEDKERVSKLLKDVKTSSSLKNDYKIIKSDKNKKIKKIIIIYEE